MDMNEMNRQIIAEFRENAGKVGGMFEGAPMLILHSTGAKSGKERLNPLMYQAADDRMYIFASKAGAPDNPDWYYNVTANPQVTLEVGSETIGATASEVTGADRDRIWEAQKQAYPQFAEYEASTSRTIPVIALDRS